jgi:hypothetical protein
MRRRRQGDPSRTGKPGRPQSQNNLSIVRQLLTEMSARSQTRMRASIGLPR